jgi:eukaryotic-like serine/threonine-protein kinase
MASPGTSLGPYSILGSIGAGGMGEVYRARDPRLGREVAIKVLPPQFAADADRLRRFEQEARAAAALNHPNILAIYDLGTQPNGSPYIVSELLEGETLRERLRSGPLPIRKATEFAAQIARGLAAAHDKHIVHRDLKPENIFLMKDGRAKILDFGLAKLTERKPGEADTFAPTETGTTPGMVLGTVGYMSPEQVRGLEADHRCDIFSFGAILYEMLSGKRAFRGDTNADTISAILKDDPAELTETNRAVPPAVERIVRHCLEKNPEERFQSASDIAFNLEALSTISSGSMAAVSAAAPMPAARRRAVFAAIGTLGLVVVATLAWWLGAATARPNFPTYKPITFRQGSIANARFGPDGQTVIYSAAWEGGQADVYTGRTDSLGERSMGLPDALVLSISPAGEMAIRTKTVNMGGFARRGLLSIVPTAGGAPRPTMEDVQEVDYSADGEKMAIVRFFADNELWRLEYPVGTVLLEGSNWVSAPHISRDGKYVAFFDHGNSFGDDRGAVAVVDLKRHEKILSDGWASLEGLAWSPKGDEVWFTGSHGEIHNMYAVTLSGKLRQLASMPADVELEDVRADGKVLLKKQSMHFEIYGGGEGPTERKLDWLDWSLLHAISNDGKYILFEEEGEGGGPEYTVYMRPLDGGPAIALGHGLGMAFSPDNRWALTIPLGTPGQFVLQPTGAGEPRTLTHDQIDHLNGWFLPDGKRIVFLGRESGHAARLYLLDIDSGTTKPLTPEGVTGRAISWDGNFVVVRGKSGWLKWPIAGGEPTPIPGLQGDDIVLSFSADNKQLYVTRREEVRPRKVYLFDLATQKRTLWKSLGPQDWTGTSGVGNPVISRDGKHYAYLTARVMSELYVVNGLR